MENGVQANRVEEQHLQNPVTAEHSQAGASAGIAESRRLKGLRYRCKVNGKEGLSRNIKLGPSAVVKIDDLCTCKSAGGLNLEITSVGALINVLGELIAQDQGKVDLLSDKTLSIKNIEEMKAGNKSFVLHLDDPRGESFIQPLTSSNTDLMLKMEIYDPSMSSDFNMDAHILQVLEAQKQADSSDDPKVYALGGDCPVCGHNDCCSRACVTSIPHFDEVCIWSTTCDKCGYKNTNVTPISIPKSRGARITLKITDPQDFDRYILQSVTTKIIIEELGLEASLTSNAGQFTTIEGALKGLYELYASSASVSLQHESSASGAEPEDVVKAKEFLEKFQKVAEMKVVPLTITLDDPCAASKIQNIHAPDEDPNMTIEYYTPQNEEERNP